jgi:hypothetical protein
MCLVNINNNFLIVRGCCVWRIYFVVQNLHRQEELAKTDPAAAAKQYHLRKCTFSNGKSWLVFSKLTGMQIDNYTPVPGGLNGNEERAFLDAIKVMKE